jgi:thiol-disulfide isomerase/thioredoxin
MNKKMMTGILAGVLLLGGCTQNAVQPTASASASAETEKNLNTEYTQLPEENAFYYLEKDGVETLLLHGTGILYLGFPECPWCQAYVPQLNTVLLANEAKAAYYNIHTDKSEDRTFYDQIAKDIEDVNDTGSTIIQYDNDGKAVIYMPLVLFVKNGRITAYNNETCMEDSSVIKPEAYWTEEKKNALQTALNKFVAEIKTVQKENEAKGCDNGCKVD